LSKARTRVPKVNDEDLIWYGPVKLILAVLQAGLLGIVGFTISGIAIGLQFPPLLEDPNSLLIFVNAGTYSFSLLAGLRNRILRRIAHRGFILTFWSQRAFRGMFWVAVILATYSILVAWGIIPNYSSFLFLLFMGLYFLLVMPSLVFSRLMPKQREARLCLSQFLHDWNLGKPKLTTGHSWLRRSLRGVEQQLRTFGLSTPAGTLFLGSSYSIFKGTMSSPELEELGNWLIKPGDWFKVNWTIPYLVSQAEVAEDSGFGKPLGALERLVRLPWRNLSYVTGIVVAIPTIVGAIYAVLRFFRIVP